MKKTHKREERALNELRNHHSYLMYELRHKVERDTMIATRSKGGKSIALRPGVAIKLVVPSDSVLGKEIVAMRKTKKPLQRRT